MISFSNTRQICRYPNSSIIHLPVSEYIFNVYSPFGYTNDFFDSPNSTKSYSKKRKKVGR